MQHQGVGRGERLHRVFSTAGNAYRLIVSFNYRHRAGYVKFFGTHGEYDRINAATVDRT